MKQDGEPTYPSDIGTISLTKPSYDTQIAYWGHAAADVEDYEIDDLRPEDLEYEHPVWWVDNPNCDGGEDTCRCGPISLIGVMASVNGDVVQSVVEQHVEAVIDIYEHFWSGDALLNADNLPEEASFDGLCTDCVISGVDHVGKVFSEAHGLSVDIAEAIAVDPAVVSAAIAAVATRRPNIIQRQV